MHGDELAAYAVHVDAVPGPRVELFVVEDFELGGLLGEVWVEFVEFVDFGGVAGGGAAVLRVGGEARVVPFCGPQGADGGGFVGRWGGGI